MSCSSSEPLPPIAVVAVVAVAVVPVVAVVAFVVVAVVVAPCPWPSPSPWPPAGLAAGFALRVGFPCRSLLLLNGSAVGWWCVFFWFLMLGLLSFAFSCVHSLFYLRCCCVVRLLILFCVLLWVFHQQHTRHNGHHRQAHHHGDHHHSVAVFIRKTVQLFTKEPSIFNCQRHDRTLSIESSTHVDGNEITVQREQNRRNLGIVC